MPSKKQVRRLGDIALIHVAEVVGLQIADLIRQCDPDDLQRNAVLLKDNVCICIPAAMFDEFVTNVLVTMSRVEDLDKMSRFLLFELMAPPIILIIDQLSVVKPFPEVSEQLMLLVYKNLHRLKKLRILDLTPDYLIEPEIVCSGFNPIPGSRLGGQLQLHKDYNMPYIERLSCPSWFFHERIMSVLQIYSRLKVLTIYPSSRWHVAVSTIFDALKPFSALREVELNGATYAYGDMLEVLLSRNRYLEKLSVECNPEAFTRSNTIYPTLRCLFVRYTSMNDNVIKTIAMRFPNLVYLELYLEDEFDPSSFTTFPNLCALSIVLRNFQRTDLRALLREVGEKIISLVFLTTPISRSDLFAIYKHCKNCEVLKLDCEAYGNFDPFVVPPFRKLKHIELEITDQEMRYRLDLTELRSLEYLRYSNFEITVARLEVILLDAVNFPRLRHIVPRIDESTEERSIPQFIEQHNLDVTYSPMVIEPL